MEGGMCKPQYLYKQGRSRRSKRVEGLINEHALSVLNVAAYKEKF